MKIKVNNILYEPKVSGSMRLLDYLRNELKLTGTKEGCGEGECGACTILLNGKPVNSCLILLGQCDEKEIITIEGLNEPELTKSFEEVGAVQCGFCTPGMMISSSAFLEENPSPTKEEVKTCISGNLCRCTGYKKIEEAIMLTADKKKLVK